MSFCYLGPKLQSLAASAQKSALQFCFSTQTCCCKEELCLQRGKRMKRERWQVQGRLSRRGSGS